jgi:trehalose 6-phosphate phosphatase
MTRADPLAAVADAPERSALLVDFDGSLAPIVEDPPSARPLPGAVEALARLVPLLGRVGVVSGRPVSFLQEALPVEGLDLAGVYGLERLAGGHAVVVDAVTPWVAAVAAAAADLAAALPDLYLERKGQVSCVVHWRACPEREAEALTRGLRIAADHGLVAQPARMALELRPPVDVDKGTMVRQLVAGFEVGVFAGDDHGDLAAFDALDALVSEGALRRAVKICVLAEEGPLELQERADERVRAPEELVALLSALADSLGVGDEVG